VLVTLEESTNRVWVAASEFLARRVVNARDGAIDVLDTGRLSFYLVGSGLGSR